MAKPQIAKGYVFVGGKGKNKVMGKDSIESFPAALKELAKCDACGCDDCLGYETIISATTGELLIRYYTGAEGGPYTENIYPFDDATNGIDAVKSLYAARTS